jgi:hypothetical protein
MNEITHTEKILFNAKTAETRFCVDVEYAGLSVDEENPVFWKQNKIIFKRKVNIYSQNINRSL